MLCEKSRVENYTSYSGIRVTVTSTSLLESDSEGSASGILRGKDSPVPKLVCQRPPATGPLLQRQLQPVPTTSKHEPEPEDDSFMSCVPGQTLGPDQKYRSIRKLGSGNFSTVWLCKNIETRKYEAIKIHKSDEDFKAVARDEISLLQFIRNAKPNHEGYDKVIFLKDHFMEEVGPSKSHVCLTFDVMGPTLWELIVQTEFKGFEQAVVKTIIKQVLMALTYLHDVCDIVHTDIKPENILVSVSEAYVREMAQSDPDLTLSHSQVSLDEHIIVKLADLGNSCFENRPYTRVIQTMQYRALEVLIDAGYSFPADIWSVGCLAFELSTGEYLFDPRRTNELSYTEDHLGQIWETLNGIPKYIARGGKSSHRFFDSEGKFKSIPPTNLKIWSVEEVLVEKYKWGRVDAILLGNFIQLLIEPDPQLRATASTALQLEWLNE